MFSHVPELVPTEDKSDDSLAQNGHISPPDLSALACPPGMSERPPNRPSRVSSICSELLSQPCLVSIRRPCKRVSDASSSLADSELLGRMREESLLWLSSKLWFMVFKHTKRYKNCIWTRLESPYDSPNRLHPTLRKAKNVCGLMWPVWPDHRSIKLSLRQPIHAGTREHGS